MNGTECAALYEDVVWTDPSSLLILTVLLLITLMVIVGNLLVIAAVYYSSKLRTVTNLFIVSLAVADFLVGVAVLPFSSPLEVFKVWLFGDIWCSVWLAVDVWMCTASILNLCAISLDRYVAVTRPVNYPSIMSSSRAKYLIAGVWVLSFVICFPPLVGWKDAAASEVTGTEVPEPLAGLGTLLIRGQHTVITSPAQAPAAAAAADAFPTLFSYHTNFSEHVIEATNKVDDTNFFSSFKVDLTGEEDLANSMRSKRTISSFSGVPVLSGDIFDTVSGSSEPPEEVGGPGSGVPGRTRAPHCPWVCELTSETGYVIYSALGSFFIPMTVMLFFYWRIYRAAVLTTRAINQGFRTTKGSGAAFGNRFDEQRLTLRIHRGRGSVQNHHTCTSHTNLTTNGGHKSLSASPSTTSTGKSPELDRLHRTGSHSNRQDVKISVSYPSSDTISSIAASNSLSSPRPSEKTPLTPSLRRSSLTTPKRTCFSLSSAGKPPEVSPKRTSQAKSEVMFAVHYSNKNGREMTETSVCKGIGGGGGGGGVREPSCYLRVSNSRASTPGRRSLSIDSTNSRCDEESACSRRNSTKSQIDEGLPLKDLSPSPTFGEHAHKQKAVPKMGKRNIKAQVKRFRMETKAAKTLAIIMGGFIVCWMPFFTIYLVRAFCADCINPVVFSVLFWLGYCNSAINPCIYALFSKDFRFAFKKIICRCLCGKEQPLNLKTKRRGSDVSGIKTPMQGRRRSVSQVAHNSQADDSDPGGGDSQ